MSIQGIACGSEPLSVDLVGATQELQVHLRFASSIVDRDIELIVLGPDGAEVHRWREHVRDVDLTADGSKVLYVLSSGMTDHARHTIRFRAFDALGNPGPATDCLVDLRIGPFSFPFVNPLVGAEAVYALFDGTEGSRGGVGVPGAFVVPKPRSTDTVAYEYGFTSPYEEPESWTRIDATPNALIPYVPQNVGLQYLWVREVDDDGLVGGAAVMHMDVAAEGQASEPAPAVGVRDVADTDPTDGKTPVDIRLSTDLMYAYGTVRLFLGEAPVASVVFDGGTRFTMKRLLVDSALLGQGLADVRAEYSAFEGAPIAAAATPICADSCEFTGGTVGITGDLRGGGTLTATLSGASPLPTGRVYQWYRDGVPIAGATMPRYSVQLDDAGHDLQAVVTATRPRFVDLVSSASVRIPAVPAGHSLTVVYEETGSGSRMTNGATLGVTGQGQALKPFTVGVTTESVAGDISATDGSALLGELHVAGRGWLGEVSGTSMTSRTISDVDRVEAFRLRLADPMAERWDLYYRAHSQNFGWLGWAKNGGDAGTTGYGFRVEAIQVVLVPKGGAAPGGSGLAASYDKATQWRISVSAHVQNVGWMTPVAGGQTAGTEGRGLRVEALRFGVAGDVPGGIEASAHVQNIGWQPFVGTGGLVGTEGQALRVEAFRIRLTGQLAEKYDVYYRTHAQNFGWLGWAKNGEDSGTAGYAYRLEAVQVVLVPKGGPAPSGTGGAYFQR